jgi:predicted ATPase
MIDRVHFENFKSLQHLTLQLGQLTALVGANGCGKSSVLEGMAMISGSTVKAPLGEDGALPVLSQRLAYRGHAGAMKLSMHTHDGQEHALERQFEARPVRSQIELTPFEGPASISVAYLHLEPKLLTQTTVAQDEQPRMAPDGEGLASALAWLKGAAEDDFALLTSDLRAVVPGVRRIRTLRERTIRRRMDKLDINGQPIWRPVDEAVIGDRFSIEFDDGSEVPADLLSEGTVLTLGMLTKLREPGRPRLMLLDDIDRGLHLSAQVQLVGVLRELMKLDPELQIVCTTHSPYLLDLFEPSEVRVLALDAERRTHARPLVEHPEFDKWKFGTQTGELWATLGEDWVTQGAHG